MTEKLAYRVVETFADFELRQYEPFFLIEIDQPGDWLRAGNMAFRPLVGYISGENVERQKYAMTAPVLQTAPTDALGASSSSSTSTGTTNTVAFVLPASARGAVPRANDPRIRVVENPGGLYAAARFRGSWSERIFQDRARELAEAAELAGLTCIAAPLTARYDGPWKPGFAKRNEVLVAVKR